MNWDQLSQWFPGLDWRLVLVYLRVQACVLALPGLGERVIPARVKVGLAMAVSPLIDLRRAFAYPFDSIASIGTSVTRGSATYWNVSAKASLIASIR